MSTTLDLINAISNGDSQNIEKHFEYLMTSRIAERLDDMRVDVSKNMFKEELDEEKKLVDKSKLPDNKENMKDGKKKRVLSYSTKKDSINKNYFMVKNIDEMEDITPEEIEEFMQTEDFEQLDEISKDTLRSYMDKSVQSYSDTGTEIRAKLQKGEEDPKLKKKIMNRLTGQMTAYNKLKK